MMYPGPVSLGNEFQMLRPMKIHCSKLSRLIMSSFSLEYSDQEIYLVDLFNDDMLMIGR